jgi:DNA-binding transcriptional ArsR family regulator
MCVMALAAAAPDPFHAIAEPNRRALLELLREDERDVGTLVGATGLSYSLVSQHLQVLRDADTVECWAAGRRRLYRLNAAPLQAVHDWTATYERFWSDRLDRLDRQLAEGRSND